MQPDTHGAPKQLDKRELEPHVKAMYRDVARKPEGKFHFELGRSLAERLGYKSADLDRIPGAAVASFAGVGYHFDLAGLLPGQRVLVGNERIAAKTFRPTIFDRANPIGIGALSLKLAHQLGPNPFHTYFCSCCHDGQLSNRRFLPAFA